MSPSTVTIGRDTRDDPRGLSLPATTSFDAMTEIVTPHFSAPLSEILALERANLNAWPSAGTLWDADWCLRLTPGARSRRINSVTVFRPEDDGDIVARLARMSDRFRAHGKTPTFRWTPLCPPALTQSLGADGWQKVAETIVMTRPVGNRTGSEPGTEADRVADAAAVELGEWVRKLGEINGPSIGDAVALRATLASVVPESKRLLIEADHGKPVAAGFCVADGACLGLFLVCVDAAHRRQGHARTLLAAALAFGAQNGAETAWLQVEADNHAALELYAGAGFRERYRYFYLQPEWGHKQ